MTVLEQSKADAEAIIQDLKAKMAALAAAGPTNNLPTTVSDLQVDGTEVSFSHGAMALMMHL